MNNGLNFSTGCSKDQMAQIIAEFTWASFPKTFTEMFSI